MNRNITIFIAALLISILIGAAQADIFMKQKHHTDSFTMMGQTQPAKDTFSSSWFTTDKIRSDQDKNSTILRLDKNMMYILDHTKKTIMEMPLNLGGVATEKLPGNMGIVITVTPTNENKKINNWNCKKYLQKMEIMGMSMSSEVWASEDIKIDLEMYSKFISAAFQQNPMLKGDLDKVTKEMKKIKGVHVLTITNNAVMGQNMKTLEELVEFKESIAPAGIFDVPAGYKKVNMGTMGK